MIDTHVHVYSLDKVAYPRLSVKTQPPPEPAEAADYLGVARKNSISKAVLIQPTFYGTDTRYIFHVASKYPDKFRAIIIAEYWHETGLNLLREQIIKKYVSGGRLNISADTRDNVILAADRNIQQSIDIITDAGKVVDLHVRFEQLEFAANLALRYRKTMFVIDHMGYPEPGDEIRDADRIMIDQLAGLLNICVKISGFEMKSVKGYPFKDMIVFTKFLLGTFGEDRCMWGSNYPYINNAADVAGSVSLANNLVDRKSEEVKKSFYSGSAQRLFWDGLQK